MKRMLSLSLMAIAAAAAAPVFADDITVDPVPFQSTATRAQVMQEFRQVRALGVEPTAMEYNPLMYFRSARTRGEVTAEFMAERDRVTAFQGEDSGSAYIARHEIARPGGMRLAAKRARP